MNRLVEIVLVVLMLFIFTSTASADAVVQEGRPSPNAVRFTNIYYLTPRLSITSAGRADCSGSVLLSSAAYSVELSVTLQQSSGSGWTDVASWTKTGPGVPEVAIAESQNVAPGTYRVRATARVFSGGTLVETASQYTSYMVYR